MSLRGTKGSWAPGLPNQSSGRDVLSGEQDTPGTPAGQPITDKEAPRDLAFGLEGFRV